MAIKELAKILMILRELARYDDGLPAGSVWIIRILGSVWIIRILEENLSALILPT